MIKDLGMLYAREITGDPGTLTPPEFQFSDYAVWEQGNIRKDLLVSERGYWQEELSGELPILNLPTDRRHPALPTYRAPRNQGRPFQDLAVVDRRRFDGGLLGGGTLLHRFYVLAVVVAKGVGDLVPTRVLLVWPSSGSTSTIRLWSNCHRLRGR